MVFSLGAFFGGHFYCTPRAPSKIDRNQSEVDSGACCASRICGGSATPFASANQRSGVGFVKVAVLTVRYIPVTTRLSRHIISALGSFGIEVRYVLGRVLPKEAYVKSATTAWI